MLSCSDRAAVSRACNTTYQVVSIEHQADIVLARNGDATDSGKAAEYFTAQLDEGLGFALQVIDHHTGSPTRFSEPDSVCHTETALE